MPFTAPIPEQQTKWPFCERGCCRNHTKPQKAIARDWCNVPACQEALDLDAEAARAGEKRRDNKRFQVF